MIFFLINISFIFIIFCIEVGIFPILPDNISDPWIAKEFLALSFALGISFYFFYKNKISFNNKHILISLVYLLIHPFLVPGLDFGDEINNQSYRLAIYRPLCHIIIYALFLFTVSSINFTKKSITQIINIFYWSGIITSVYCVFQYFGFDGRQILNSSPNTNYTSGKNVVGFMAHPNYSGIFLATMLPFVWHKNKKTIILLILAILMTESMVACFGVFIFILSLIHKKFGKKFTLIIFSTCFIIGALFLFENPSVGNGRVNIWLESIKLLLVGPDGNSHIFLGYGFGSYKPLIVGFLDMSFFSMHCDPLQWVFETGLVGLFLLIFSLKWLIVNIYDNIMINDKSFCFSASFVILLFCSLGSFVFQVEPHRYIGVFLLGYLHNLARRKL